MLAAAPEAAVKGALSPTTGASGRNRSRCADLGSTAKAPYGEAWRDDQLEVRGPQAGQVAGLDWHGFATDPRATICSSLDVGHSASCVYSWSWLSSAGDGRSLSGPQSYITSIKVCMCYLSYLRSLMRASEPQCQPAGWRHFQPVCRDAVGVCSCAVVMLHAVASVFWVDSDCAMKDRGQ